MSTAHLPPRLGTPVLPPVVRLADIRLPPDVVAELDRFDLPPEQRRQVERDYKLSYKFGGGYVLLRESPDGDEVLAAGNSEAVVSWFDDHPDEQSGAPRVILYRQPWAGIVRDLGLRQQRRRWWRLWLS